ncbi:stage II sporulation protein P [Desulfitispora alkaliphila]|uniref:stage II sporulation protein P n=1 Tax=Desulfitispora alkaliphila TaxID=622674 RepID=UPI003D25ABF2
MRNKLRLLGLVLLMAGVISLGYNATYTTTIQIPEIADLGVYEVEREDGYFTIVDEEGNVLDKTARMVYEGDEFISADNRHYRVISIEGDTAHAKYIGDIEMNWSGMREPEMPVTGAVPVQGEENPVIAIYHTHTAESYVPDEGEPFIEAEGGDAQGGIVEVGEILSNKLNEIGIETILNTDPHEPHDSNAYHRSRRTVAGLLEEQPIAIVDVHRDAVPDPDFYTAEINGEQVSKIRLVVGRQNQNIEANREFAEQLKAAADELYPGLMHGIFMGRGNYNQDMHPRSTLIEAGTHVTSKEEAERGVILFAEALPKVLGIEAGGAPQAPASGGDYRSIGWIIGLSLLAGGIFLLVSTGSFSGASEKLKQLTGSEWANFLGSKRDKEKYKRANVYESSINKKAFDIENNKKPDHKENKDEDK